MQVFPKAIVLIPPSLAITQYARVALKQGLEVKKIYSLQIIIVSNVDLAECQSDADNVQIMMQIMMQMILMMNDFNGDVDCSNENCDDDDNDHLDHDG